MFESLNWTILRCYWYHQAQWWNVFRFQPDWSELLLASLQFGVVVGSFVSGTSNLQLEVLLTIFLVRTKKKIKMKWWWIDHCHRWRAHSPSFYCVALIAFDLSNPNSIRYDCGMWITCACVKFSVSDQRFDPIIGGSCIASPNFSIIIPSASAIAHSPFIRCRMDDALARHARTTFHSSASSFFRFIFKRF